MQDKRRNTMLAKGFATFNAMRLMALLPVVAMAGCESLRGLPGGGSGEGIPDATAPTVTHVTPADAATGVPIDQTLTATFSEAMDASTITTTTFAITAPGATPVTGTVAYDAASHMATFTPASNLAPNALYTATITTGAKDLAGNALASDFVWSFTTGATQDTTAPTVSSTVPANAATGVAINQKIAATFSEAMDPLTMTTATFTLQQGTTPVSGTVTHVGLIATFTAASNLAPSTTYTATISTGARDLAGNAVAGDFAWSFTTGATQDTTAPTVISTNPANNATGVAVNAAINATFSEAMDPSTITTADFTVTGPGGTSVTGTVAYDVASNIASFAPASDSAIDALYTATITTGVKDLAGNVLVSDYVWRFTTGSAAAGEAPVVLESASTFAVLAGSTVTNVPGVGTAVTGDIGVSPGTAVTGFPPGTVNGTIYNATPGPAATAKLDLTAAYLDAQGRSVGSQTLPGNLGGLTFTPGLYTNSTSVMISGSGPGNNVTLDAQGDASAVFIFQMGSTLTTGPGAQVILSGGAKASNVYWQVGTSATLDTTTIFKGNILAEASITMNAGATLEGRALTQTGAVSLSSNIITIPAP